MAPSSLPGTPDFESRPVVFRRGAFRRGASPLALLCGPGNRRMRLFVRPTHHKQQCRPCPSLPRRYGAIRQPVLMACPCYACFAGGGLWDASHRQLRLRAVGGLSAQPPLLAHPERARHHRAHSVVAPPRGLLSPCRRLARAIWLCTTHIMESFAIFLLVFFTRVLIIL